MSQSCNEAQDSKDDCHWLPFTQYSEPTNINATVTQWTEDYIKQLLIQTFQDHISQIDEKPDSIKTQSPKLCADGGENACTIESQKSVFICEHCSADSSKNFIIENKGFGNELFKTRASKEYWEKLFQSSLKKKSPKKMIFLWKQKYLKLLPLDEPINEEDNNVIMDNQKNIMSMCLNHIRTECLCNLTSYESGSEESDDEELDEISVKSDPIYSRFGELRNAFHTAEDGVVFYSQRQLDKYKQKMSEMKEEFQFGIEQIKYQHDQLRAKRAEERKLLSGKMNSLEQDTPDYEPSEKDALNTDNHEKQTSANKQERKSALFSSFHDAFNYARTGIQGMFVKNSPNGSRKVRTDDNYSDSSDDEEEKLGASLLSKNPEDLTDFHDEFTRKMSSDGGLIYKSSDKSDQQLSYQNLPPPLSLNTLPAKANT